MFIYTKTMPNGAIARFHKAIRFEVHDDATHAVVSSYHLEEMEMISWQDTYTIPREIKIASLQDVELVLTLPGAPFEGAQLIDPLASDLDQAKARKWAEVKQARRDAELGGFVGPLGRVQSDVASQAKINGFAEAGEAVDFIMEDNSVITHSPSQLVELRDAMMEHLKTCAARSQELRAAIESATTVEALASVVWQAQP